MPEPDVQVALYGFSIDVFRSQGGKPIVAKTYMTNSLFMVAEDLRKIADHPEDLGDQEGNP